MQVLIVQHDADTCEALARCLRLDGFEVEVAIASGRDALKAAEVVRTPDVILLDLHMSDTGGRAFHREQKRRPAVAEIPVIVMTGLPLNEAAGKMDAAAFVSKACTMESLTATILALLRSCRSRLREKQSGSDSSREARTGSEAVSLVQAASMPS